VVFADAPNIVEAAQMLNISQPLLSKHLQALQDDLGLELFEFAGRKKVLTSRGKEIHSLMKSQLGILGTELRQTLVKQTRSQALKIGGRKEVLEPYVRSVQYEGSLIYLSMDSEQVEKQLRAKQIDIGISQKDIDSDRLVRKKALADEFVLCWNSKIKISPAKGLTETIKALRPYRCFDYSESSVLKPLLEKLDLQLDHPQTTFSDWRVLTQAVQAEKGWGLMPLGHVAPTKDIDYLNLPTEFSRKSQFYVYYQKEFSRLPWFSALIQEFTK
jgi:DNA-binding transcriptional LysR family regulator